MKRTPVTPTDGLWSLACAGSRHAACVDTECLCPHHNVADAATGSPSDATETTLPGEHGSAGEPIGTAAIAQRNAAGVGEVIGQAREPEATGFESLPHSGSPTP